MNGFTQQDALFLADSGITSEPQRSGERSGWPPERLLQAAADGALHMYGLDGDAGAAELAVRVYIDARPAGLDECAALTDLFIADHLVLLVDRVALTATGLSTLARWSKYRRYTRRNRDGDQR